MISFFKNIFIRQPHKCDKCGISEEDLKLNPEKYKVFPHDNITFNKIEYKHIIYKTLCEKCYSEELHQIFSSDKFTHRLMFCDTCPDYFVVKKHPKSYATTCENCRRHRLQRNLV